jgi:hypothetical protein
VIDTVACATGMALLIGYPLSDVAVVLWLRASHPDAVARIGSILGEEGGTDAAILD